MHNNNNTVWMILLLLLLFQYLYVHSIGNTALHIAAVNGRTGVIAALMGFRYVDIYILRLLLFPTNYNN